MNLSRIGLVAQLPGTDKIGVGKDSVFDQQELLALLYMLTDRRYEPWLDSN